MKTRLLLPTLIQLVFFLSFVQNKLNLDVRNIPFCVIVCKMHFFEINYASEWKICFRCCYYEIIQSKMITCSETILNLNIFGCPKGASSETLRVMHNKMGHSLSYNCHY